MTSSQEGISRLRGLVEATVDQSKIREVGGELSVSMPTRAFDFVTSLATGTTGENQGFVAYAELLKSYPKSLELYQQAAKIFRINSAQPTMMKAAFNQLEENLFSRINQLRLKAGEIGGDEVDALLFGSGLEQDQEEKRTIDDVNEELGILYFLLADIVSPEASKAEPVVVNAAPAEKTKLSEEEVRNTHAFRDFAVYMGWIPYDSPEVLTGEVVERVRAEFIRFLIVAASDRFWSAPTNPEGGKMNLMNWEMVSKGADRITVERIFEKSPEDEGKVLFQNQILLIGKLLTAGNEWARIAKRSSFEQIEHYAAEYMPDEERLEVIANLRSPEQFSDPTAVPIGQSVNEATWHYLNWQSRYIEATRKEVDDIRREVTAQFSSGQIVTPSEQDMARFLQLQKNNKPSDLFPQSIRALAQKTSISFEKLGVIWRSASTHTASGQARRNIFIQLLIGHTTVERVNALEVLVKNEKFKIWPLELVNDAQTKKYRKEVAIAVGVQRLSKGRYWYDLKMDEHTGGKVFDSSTNREINTSSLAITTPEGDVVSYLSQAYKEGAPYELLGYEQAITLLEPIIQDRAGIQTGKGHRIFNTGWYMSRKAASGQEGMNPETKDEVRRLALPPGTLLSARLSSADSARMNKPGMRLKALFGHWSLFENAAHSHGFSVIGTEAGDGLRNKEAKILGYAEKLYIALTQGFGARELDISLVDLAKIERENALFTTQEWIKPNDRVIQKLTDFVESLVKYWVADYLVPVSALASGYDTDVWEKITIGNAQGPTHATPIFKHILNLSEDKRDYIYERAQEIGLDRAIIVHMLKLIITESLLRMQVRKMKNEDVASIFYVFTGKAVGGYEFREGGASLAKVVKMTVPEVAECFLKAGITVDNRFLQTFQQAGGVA